MHFISDELDDYVVQHSADEPELLQALTRESYNSGSWEKFKTLSFNYT